MSAIMVDQKGGGMEAPGMTPATYYWNLLLERLPLKLAKPTAGIRCERGVTIKTPTRLTAGSGVVLQRYSLLHCGGKPWCGFRGGIELGDDVVVGPNCVLYGAGTIRVGRYTHFGPSSMVMSQSGDPASSRRYSEQPDLIFAPVVLGEGVWVGAGAVILGGSTLGDGCIIGPNSVVQGDYEPGTTLIGNPARAVWRKPPEAGK